MTEGFLEVLAYNDSPSLITHNNYLEYLDCVLKNVELKYKNRISKSEFKINKKLSSRINLINLTYESLISDKKQVDNMHEYSRVCSAWVAVKGYYLLFYLETMIVVLAENDISKLNSTHNSIRKYMNNYFSSGAIISRNTEATKIIKNSNCLNFKLKSGDNLRAQLSGTERYNQIMKKLSEYAKDDFKRKNKIKSLRGEKKNQFMEQKICLLDFFYWYRIKSNYRDLEFISNDISSESGIYNFFISYTKAIIYLSRAYIDLINNIYQTRIGTDENLISYDRR